MFDLDQAIANWRREMFRAGLQRPEVLDELESHLREEVAGQIQTGTTEQAAFEAAVRRIGETKHIKREFKKIETANWNHSLAWTAWGLFVISFFLPADGYDGPGWKCALMSFASWSWPEMKTGEWLTIHLALLSFANLFMVASPYLLSRLTRNNRRLMFLRFSNFAALALVWSFISLFFFHYEGKDLKIGCYLWMASFLVLFLSLFPRLKRKEQYVRA